jgi:nucleoporin NUP82
MIVRSESHASLQDLLQGNHLAFLPDPIHDDAVYVYHAFGVHALHLGAMLQKIATALREDTGDGCASLTTALQRVGGASVHQILNSFSTEQR